MIDETPDRNATDEDHYRSPALCDVCGRRPGSVAVEGEWVCELCDAALELAEEQT